VGYAIFAGDVPVDVGHMQTNVAWPETLTVVAQWLNNSVFTWGPIDAVASEMPVYYRNAKTTIMLAQLVGVIRYVARNHGPFIEVLPSERLLALGLPIHLPRKVAKAAVMRLVNAEFGLSISSDHESDAIAVGLAALRKLKIEEMERKG
jgi:Holliday junction resolvasome RuvABC endonuclease subunit